ncbi:hypothetical protein ARMSODRAFT_477694 [Armillaria solidipes]|uniref:Uncharacterized protein n=1 Tax=Armillaria solidipes TaxID=1076256 RepID=A0A2H3B3F8_9AGAR|nr:hypothetical protein ARMSODRAFT_477694 [Armillaria solidipes]
MAHVGRRLWTVPFIPALVSNQNASQQWPRTWPSTSAFIPFPRWRRMGTVVLKVDARCRRQDRLHTGIARQD